MSETTECRSCGGHHDGPCRDDRAETAARDRRTRIVETAREMFCSTMVEMQFHPHRMNAHLINAPGLIAWALTYADLFETAAEHYLETGEAE